ncbi:MAG: pyridoxal-phosphate-dependent aminotransferase family protein [Eubacteriales bacterium]|jgi:aspartate aminotransferase-like enzyme
MNMLWMTPGPTQVRENVRLARAMETGNSDLEADFYSLYHETCALLSQLLHTANPSYLLSGEGILGLEAACASLTQPGDRVLVLDNGIFGRGFADFVRLYGGAPVLYTRDYTRPFDPDELEAFLRQDHDFTYATLVHCDTPTGLTNDIHTLCPLLARYGLLTVVDSVAGMFGERVDVDQAGIDILCGGTQKALSAPVGMTLLTVSPRALEAMQQRTVPIAAFYANILQFKDYWENQWFPYTMPYSDILGVRQALLNVAEDPQALIRRHSAIAGATRHALTQGGLSLYLTNGFSNNVTVFHLPDGLSDQPVLDHLARRYQVGLAGSLGPLAGSLLRIGHMGENANPAHMTAALDALDRTLRDLGHPPACRLGDSFLAALSNHL